MPVIGTAEIEGDKIIYTPTEIPLADGTKTREITTMASSKIFETGEICFKVQSKHKNFRCQVILSENNPFYIGFSSMESNTGLLVAAEYDIQANKWNFLDFKGDNRSFKLDTEYELRLSVKGSKIHLFVDDVLVMSLFKTITKAPVKLLIGGEGKITVSNIQIKTESPIAFVVMQFSEEYNQLFDEVIEPTCKEKGFECIRANDKYTTSPIIQDIIESIHESSVIIANITPDNPNVFYEVGFAHAIRKPTILLCDRKREGLPFDLSGFRTLFYENTIAGKSNIEKDLKKYLDNLSG